MGGMGYIQVIECLIQLACSSACNQLCVLLWSQSNHAVILYNNAMMSHNILEAARQNGVQRFFYASSACVYPESKLVSVCLRICSAHAHASCMDGQPASHPIVASKEEDAWPAQPQDAYGLEKLVPRASRRLS
jgi:GDP-D-mannose 3',5'-epimerase